MPTTSPYIASAPSGWLSQHAHLIPVNGAVLDLAAGQGRNARWLAQQGWQVIAVDRDLAALDSMQGISGIIRRQLDLEQGIWPLAGEVFAAVVVCRYLHRPLLPLLIDCLQPGGILIYETFMQGQQALGRPSNPDYLLQSQELLQCYGDQLEVLDYQQGLLQPTPAAMLQRIVARKPT